MNCIPIGRSFSTDAGKLRAGKPVMLAEQVKISESFCEKGSSPSLPHLKGPQG